MADQLVIRTRVEDAAQSAEQIQRIARGTRQLGDDSVVAGAKFDGTMGLIRGGLKSVAGYFGAAGVAFGIKDAVQAGMALQTQQAQLREALQKSGAAGTDAFDSISDAAEKSARTGGFSDPQTLQATTDFLDQTKNVAESLKATAAATDLARARNIGFSQSQRLIQRALTGSTTGLARYVKGFSPIKTAEQALSDSHTQATQAIQMQASTLSGTAKTAWENYQKDNAQVTLTMRQQAVEVDKLATGQKALAMIQGQYGGAAGRYSHTLQGQISDLKNTWEQLEANLGTVLIPVVSDAAKGLEDVASVIAKNKPLAIGLGGAVALLGTAAFGKALFGGVKYATGGIKDFGGAAKTAILWVTGLGADSEAAAAEVAEVGVAGDVAAGQMALFDEAAVATSASLGVVVGEVVLATGGLALLAFGLVEAGEHFKTLERVGESVFKTITHAGDDAWKGIKDAATAVSHAVVGAIRWMGSEIKKIFSVISHDTPFGGLVGGAMDLAHGNVGGALGSLAHGLSFGLLNTGGVVSPHGTSAKHLYSGGPAGTDTVPGWLTPGEGVVSRQGMTSLGARGLSLLNMGVNPFGGGGGNITITPGQVSVQIDGKTIARAVVQYTLERAARGPSSLVGGSLMTGVTGSS